MQRGSCDDIGLLISKYVDGEATAQEREQVDLHVASCADCASKLTNYMEFAAIFAEAPVRAPQPELRSSVFHEIGSIKEQTRLKEQAALSRRAAAGLATRRTPGRSGALSLAKVWEVASPFAALGVAVMALIAVVMVNASRTDSGHTVPGQATSVSYAPVPTIPATSVVRVANVHSDAPPVGTKLANVSPVASVSTVVQGTATIGPNLLLQLEHALPVMENGDAWHSVADARFSYSIQYPGNWWTTSENGTRLFFPWTQGGTHYAPYWIEMHVEANPQHVDAAAYNRLHFKGQASLVGGNGSPVWLSYRGGDEANTTHEIYAFNADSIYVLRLSVPVTSLLGDFSPRWTTAEDIFTRMSRRVSFGGPSATALFLNGGDVWSVSTSAASDAKPVWRGYNTQWAKQFVASPDNHSVAVAITNKADDLWAKDVYITGLNGTDGSSQPLLRDAEIHDVAWYDDHNLLVLANVASSGLGIYRIATTAAGPADVPTTELLVKLGDDMAGARGISVSPDRQLITFLAPLGKDANTDIYSVRPDGSNLMKIVSHDSAALSDLSNPDMQSAADLAVKSYTWVEGKLETDGYAYNMLFTCGNSDSPTLHRGGFMYSAASSTAGSLLDSSLLGVSDASQVQIVHIAYSPTGKVAFSGFYSVRGFKVETLAGLWTADLNSGALANLQSLPVSASNHGLSDLLWSPDGNSLIYRETVPSDEASLISRYDGHSPFTMVKLDVNSGAKMVLFDGAAR